MRVLVTGGAGFIGSHVVDRLVEMEETIFVVDNLSRGKEENINPSAKYFKFSLDAPEIEEIFKEGIDLVIHLAAQVSVKRSIDDPLGDARNNILAGLRLLEHCRKYNVKKIIYANSAAVIGNPKYFPIDEKHPQQPLSPYALSKKTFAEYLTIYSELYGLNYTSLRFANVYGPRQEGSKECGVISIFLKKVLSNQPLTIFGGDQTRDFVFVEDVVEAVMSVLGKGDCQEYNIGSGKEISIRELFEQVKYLTYSSSDASFVDMKRGEIERSVFNIDKIKNEIGWQPKTSLREGLMKTIDYLKNKDLKNEL